MSATQIEIREIKFGSDFYQQELELRLNVLRTPIGLTLSIADTEHDSTDTHLAAVQGDRLLGCCLLRILPNKTAKMRQVAVSPSAQKSGVGRLLINHFEGLARRLGATEVILDARETAISFYSQLGYEVVSELFTQVSVPHRKMRKLL